MFGQLMGASKKDLNPDKMYLIVEMEIVGTVSANKYIIDTRVSLSFYTLPSRGKYTEATVKMEVLLFKKKRFIYTC